MSDKTFDPVNTVIGNCVQTVLKFMVVIIFDHDFECWWWVTFVLLEKTILCEMIDSWRVDWCAICEYRTSDCSGRDDETHLSQVIIEESRVLTFAEVVTIILTRVISYSKNPLQLCVRLRGLRYVFCVWFLTFFMELLRPIAVRKCHASSSKVRALLYPRDLSRICFSHGDPWSLTFHLDPHRCLSFPVAASDRRTS